MRSRPRAVIPANQVLGDSRPCAERGRLLSGYPFHTDGSNGGVFSDSHEGPHARIPHCEGPFAAQQPIHDRLERTKSQSPPSYRCAAPMLRHAKGLEGGEQAVSGTGVAVFTNYLTTA